MEMTAMKAPKNTAHAIPRTAISKEPRESSESLELLGEDEPATVSGLRV